MYKRRVREDFDFFWRRQSIRFDVGEPSAVEMTSFGDGLSTQQFLTQFKNDTYAIAWLRGLLSQSRQWIGASRLTGDQVLAEVARLLLSGELGVALIPRPLSTGSNSAERTGDPPPVAAGPPLPVTKMEEPEPPTFPPDLNGVIQAAALAAAAASGAPFCPN